MKFLFGIGAQKAATSWVHDQLARHPNVWAPPEKELHVFDVRYRPDLTIGFLRNALDELAELAPDEPRSHRLRTYVQAVVDDQQYRALFPFDRMGPNDVACDVTPAYSLLDHAAFTRMRSVAVDAGCEPRVLFVLRDPVERVRSHYGMVRRAGQGVAAHEFVRQARVQERTRYDRTLRALDASAFREDEVMVEFYENLFTTDFDTRLCDFLGLPPLRFDGRRRVNASARSGDVRFDPGTEAILAKWVEPIYAFCRERFGEAIDQLWRETKRVIDGRPHDGPAPVYSNTATATVERGAPRRLAPWHASKETRA